MILVIGSEEEYHSKFIHDQLLAKGEEVCYLDTRRINDDFRGSFYPDETVLKGNLILNGRKVFLDTIKSVYWRWNYGIKIPPESNSQEDYYTAYMAEREFTSLIDSLYKSMDCLWVNSLNAINMHKTKAYQTRLMASNNIRVPKTLITNDRNELENFLKDYKGELIFKPVLGGAHTEKLDREVFDEARLNLLKNSPVQFQELLEGVDIRVYGIGDKLFSAEIRANTIDFREDKEAELVPVEIPEKIQQDCFKIMELMDLKFTGIDIKYNPKKDEYVFIEANPSPMFTFFQEKTGFPISETLISLLIKGK
jgi:glutathione synthase/RimK-type ligase-like ATP-grasp enzyme